MATFSDVVKAQPKGLRDGNQYRPDVGAKCLVSGPNHDDDHGYTWAETNILWSNETFVLYGNPGYWPCLHKWEHCLFKPVPETQSDDWFSSHDYKALQTASY